MFNLKSKKADSQVTPKIQLSVLIPLYNEEESVGLLCERVLSACRKLNVTFEVVLVDDGSKDRTFSLLEPIAKQHHEIKVIRFRKNYGQTAAISAGIDAALGDIVVMMDGDLQNDPDDIGMLLAKMNEGFDLVSGWRKNRQDDYFTRILPSKMANSVISYVTKVHLNDYGCTLKAYRRDILKDFKLYGEMHRFLPFYASLAGARICEVPVQHHARKFGVSKYGLSRTFKVLLDLVTVRYLGKYAQKPIYAFGGIGIFCIVLGVLIALFTLYLRLADGIFVHRNPLILLASILFVSGIQFFVMGLLAEIILRTYHESQDKPIYSVKTALNFDHVDSAT